MHSNSSNLFVGVGVAWTFRTQYGSDEHLSAFGQI